MTRSVVAQVSPEINTALEIQLKTAQPRQVRAERETGALWREGTTAMTQKNVEKKKRKKKKRWEGVGLNRRCRK